MKTALYIKGIVLGIIALFLVGILVFGITVGFGGVSWNYAITEMSAQYKENVNGIKEISLNYKAEDIKVELHSGKEIIIEEYLSKADAKSKTKIVRKGSSIDISRSNKSNFGLVFFGKSPHVTVKIPVAFAGDLQVNTKSGSIEIYDNLELESFTATVKSGSVTVEKIEATKSIVLTSSSGTTRANGSLEAGESIFLSSNSGSVKAVGLSAKEITCKSNSGSVKIEGKVISKEAVLASNSGSVRVSELESGSVNVTSSSGSINIEKFSGGGNFKSNSGSANIGIEKITEGINVKSSSGSVRIDLLAENQFAFVADVGSGSIHTSFGKSETHLSKDFGSNPQFKLTCSANSGSIYVEELY